MPLVDISIPIDGQFIRVATPSGQALVSAPMIASVEPSGAGCVITLMTGKVIASASSFDSLARQLVK